LFLLSDKTDDVKKENVPAKDKEDAGRPPGEQFLKLS